jgi:16S rRNA (adenine1518-N6/adenine1519-N6)-dimethyltransferase
MKYVTPKKKLGQHFLRDRNIAVKIVESLTANDQQVILEVGPGMGVLTGLLIERFDKRFYAAEIDAESIEFLKEQFPKLGNRLIFENFLKLDLTNLFSERISIIGNFPYNISSQIFFKIIENRSKVDEVVGMVQREVALRICEPPGTRTYGILSVLLQAYYSINYLFTVNEGVFTPPPRVKSAVIKLTRNATERLNCDEQLFARVVKTGFNQRRKTLRNSLKALRSDMSMSHPLLEKRPEQLSVADFVELTNFLEDKGAKI